MRRSVSHHRRLFLLGVVVASVLGFVALGASLALASVQAPWWRVSSSSAPTLLRPGDTEDVVFAAVSNFGDADADGSKATVTISDALPAGLTPKSVRLVSSAEHQEGTCEALPALRCSFAKDVQPYVRLEMIITVEVEKGLPEGQVQNGVQVQGGGAADTSASSPLTIANAPTPFGAQAVELTPEGETGGPDTQAGSHPFQLTTTLDFNQTLEAGKGIEPSAPALIKNLHFDLPPGLIGDPQATPQCSNLDFSTLYLQDTNFCPADTAVGAAMVTLNEPANSGYVSVAVPLFNLEPAPGEPARFGFEAFNVPVIFDTAVLTGGDYGVQVNVSNATSVAEVLASQVTFWVNPAIRATISRGAGDASWAARRPRKATPVNPPTRAPRFRS